MPYRDCIRRSARPFGVMRNSSYDRIRNTDDIMSNETHSISDFLDNLLTDLGPVPGRSESSSTSAANSPAAPAQTSPQPGRTVKPSEGAATVAARGNAQPARPKQKDSAPRAKRRLFFPPAPKSLKEAGLPEEEVARLIIKLVASRGSMQGRAMAAHVRLPFSFIERVLNNIRREQLLALKGDAMAGDYTYVVTEKGMQLAKQLAKECTYYGCAPVSLEQYVESVRLQSIADQRVRQRDLQRAFSDLLLEDSVLRTLGPAINSGRGLFLFGEPGNGKTSVAERVADAFGTSIWIPRAIGIDGHVIRVFDPAIHHIVPPEFPGAPNVEPAEIDQRWIRIRRPTVIAGGELTMDELEVTEDPVSHISEAPLQLKANCGVLLIDDFGRQRMPVDELLNRWIIPLEKRHDLLNLPNGKKIQIPFDELVIFSTNLEPRDLVDDAFLRRIPYKIQVPNPTPQQFHQLFQTMCGKLGIEYSADAVDHLLTEHYAKQNRELRCCHPRDLLMQIRNQCLYEELDLVLTRESMDFAVRCYFSVLT